MSFNIDELVDTPEEHFIKYRIENLSNRELLSILFSMINQESDENLLASYENDLNRLFFASIEELLQIDGMDIKRACKIKIICELGRRVFSFQEKHPQINTTDDVVKLLLPFIHLKQEEFRVVLLDSKGRAIGIPVISKGSLDLAIVDPRDVFRPAIIHGAYSIILVHNHPSGDPTPSERDILLTRELCLCGKVLEIEIIDHVIIGTEGYTSFKLRELI